MKINKSLLVAITAAAAMAASASAQLQVGGVGSSALFQTASLAAYQLAGGTGNSSAGHYTAGNAGQIIDNRDGGIVPQLGNLSVVWDNAAAPTKVWYYLSVDSVVGNRAYFSQPRAQLQTVASLPAAGQLIATSLWGADASTIPSAVLTVINNSAFTAAFTDIRPEDAKFAQNRVNCGTATTATLTCLGYGTSNPNVGTSIQSAFSSASAQPVNFNIFGNDPVSGNAIPSFSTVSIGISPIVFLVNRTNPNGFGTGVTPTSGGTFTDITYQASAQLLFTGIDCDSSALIVNNPPTNFAINPILREPLSGTMNTTEFNVFVQNQQGSTSALYFSQEGTLVSPYYIPTSFVAISPATNNPLNGSCPGGNSYAIGPQGARKRAIGTGEEVNTGVKTIADAIGYTFFSYGNVSKLAASTNYGYLQYESTDPINPSHYYNTPYSVGGMVWPGYGQLPTCNAPCPINPGLSFPNVRNGAYRAWSLLRGVADTGTTSYTNLQTLGTEVANEVNGKVPDFLPFNATTDGDPGFIGYRIHFAPAGVNFNANNTPNNGITTPSAEAGGDVGGCLDYKTDPNQIGCRY